MTEEVNYFYNKYLCNLFYCSEPLKLLFCLNSIIINELEEIKNNKTIK